jgi:ribonuclease G
MELRKDRTKTTVVGMTGLGLIEMTRKKVKEALSSALMKECHLCKGLGRVTS